MKTELKNICCLVKDKISVSEITADNYISTENMLPNKCGITASSSLPKSEKVTAYRKDDVLVSNIRPYFRKIWFAENNGGCSNDVLVFRAKSRISPEFLYYTLADDRFFNYAMKTSKGTKMPRGDKKAIMEYIVSVPDYETQKKTGYLLRLLDMKIQLNNRINKNLEEQAQAIFKSWFVDFEQFGGVMPENWRIGKVSDIHMTVTDYVANGSFASLKANVTLHQEKSYAYFIRNTDLKSGTFNVFVDKHSYDFLAKSALYGGEIIISNVGDVGSVFLCPKLDLPMTLGNNIIMLRPDNPIFQYYLYIWFKWGQGQSYIQGIKSGSAQPKFNKTEFKNTPMQIPSEKVLEKFYTISKTLFDEIAKNTSENQHLSALRDTLIPELINGETDIFKI
ncbi:MAG: restriction endonuclease subunit S [Alistipes senegalensis]|nr:restriction endonuclease subunit S [Alistipes senegalensis]